MRESLFESSSIQVKQANASLAPSLSSSSPNHQIRSFDRANQKFVNIHSVDITPHVHFEMKDPSELENLGYLLIGDQLISYAFYDRLFQKFSGQMFFFETADSIEHICGHEFWETLTPSERKAAGICVLTLIQQGHIFFTLSEEEFSTND